MTTKLDLYNEALTEHLGESPLAAFDFVNTSTPQKRLDAAWDRGAVDYCLRQGLWNFATRTVEINFNPSITPHDGYTYGFDHPSDMVRVASVCTDPHFSQSLDRYLDVQNYWLADIDPIYVQYISNDNLIGKDLSVWPVDFAKYVACYLAVTVYKSITKGTDKAALQEECRQLLNEAKNKDAFAEPTKRRPSGSWSGNRGRRGNNQRGG